MALNSVHSTTIRRNQAPKLVTKKSEKFQDIVPGLKGVIKFFKNEPEEVTLRKQDVKKGDINFTAERLSSKEGSKLTIDVKIVSKDHNKTVMRIKELPPRNHNARETQFLVQAFKSGCRGGIKTLGTISMTAEDFKHPQPKQGLGWSEESSSFDGKTVPLSRRGTSGHRRSSVSIQNINFSPPTVIVSDADSEQRAAVTEFGTELTTLATRSLAGKSPRSPRKLVRNSQETETSTDPNRKVSFSKVLTETVGFIKNEPTEVLGLFIHPEN